MSISNDKFLEMVDCTNKAIRPTPMLASDDADRIMLELEKEFSWAGLGEGKWI